MADEAFFVGTGAQVSPITEIDRRAIGDGRIGPISRKIQQLYFDVVKGKSTQIPALVPTGPRRNTVDRDVQMRANGRVDAADVALERSGGQAV